MRPALMIRLVACIAALVVLTLIFRPASWDLYGQYVQFEGVAGIIVLTGLMVFMLRRPARAPGRWKRQLADLPPGVKSAWDTAAQQIGAAPQDTDAAVGRFRSEFRALVPEGHDAELQRMTQLLYIHEATTRGMAGTAALRYSKDRIRRLG